MWRLWRYQGARSTRIQVDLMKYFAEQKIDLHRDRVVDILTDHRQRRHWQPGFQSMEPLDGEPGSVGATSLLNFKIGNQPFEMIETILKRDLPHAYTVSYVSSQSASISQNTFEDTPDGGTLWRVDLEMKLNGFSGIIAMFRPHAFQAQTQALMKSFADYAAR
jgi:carbon monoxide dehydrogenase subunit G